mmetsp:Transcript_1193/g.4041  ORF Transcript_1193/g.4041 Transcript_1193/m.4041 type:complete len:244 (-) Transcript_1193:351-1082(-)
MASPRTASRSEAGAATCTVDGVSPPTRRHAALSRDATAWATHARATSFTVTEKAALTRLSVANDTLEEKATSLRPDAGRPPESRRGSGGLSRSFRTACATARGTPAACLSPAAQRCASGGRGPRMMRGTASSGRSVSFTSHDARARPSASTWWKRPTSTVVPSGLSHTCNTHGGRSSESPVAIIPATMRQRSPPAAATSASPRPTTWRERSKSASSTASGRQPALQPTELPVTGCTRRCVRRR